MFCHSLGSDVATTVCPVYVHIYHGNWCVQNSPGNEELWLLFLYQGELWAMDGFLDQALFNT